MSKNIQWSAEMLADIKYFTSLSMNSPEVAEKMSLKYRMGITKNQIIGAARRNNIELHQPSTKKINDKNWTEEKTKKLIIMWNNNMPITDIAYQFGVSREAISRRAKILDLPERLNYKVRQAGGITARIRSKQKKPIVSLVFKNESTVSQSLNPKKFFALNSRDCRFVINDGSAQDYLFCAAPAEPGSAYCAHCHGIVYYKPSHNLERLKR